MTFYIYDTYAFTYLCFNYQLLVIVCRIFRYFSLNFRHFYRYYIGILSDRGSGGLVDVPPLLTLPNMPVGSLSFDEVAGSSPAKTTWESFSG